MVVFFDWYILAPFGGLRVPPVAADLLEQTSAFVGYAKPVGGDQAGNQFDPVSDIVVGVLDVPDTITVQLYFERGGGRVDEHLAELVAGCRVVWFCQPGCERVG